MKPVLKYLLPLRTRMATGFCIKVIGTVSELLIPFLMTYILDNVIVTGNVGRIIAFGVLMLICALVASLGNIIANRMAAKVTRDFSYEMRRELFSKTLLLSAKDTDRFTIPSLESRITSDTYNVQNFIGMIQRMGVRAPILLLGGTAITLIMDSTLSLVMLATLPIIFAVVYSISRKGVPLYTKVQKRIDSMVRVVREDAQGIRVIKALSKNDYENRRYDEVNRALCREETHAGTIMSIVNPVMTLLMNLGIAAVVAVAAYRVSIGASSPATVIAFMQYFTLISMAMMSLSRMFVMYTKCAASANRIAEVINCPDELKTIADSGNGDSNYHIAFENVDFSYFGKQNNLDNISIRLKKGQHLGLIGATGSGKSTFVKLLLRFYDPQSGSIYINGRDIRSYESKEFRAMFGVVLQSDFLYADTIEENIRFGRDISLEDIKKAAKTAQADSFIENFPDGYGHLLSAKGTNLSGGQRQRVLISRALAGNPEILILDDSSSALDYKTDATLREALSSEFSHSTVITVAQRVSSVKSCDIILVLDEGKIIGHGTHEQLMKTCTEYREISDSQMGGAFVE
ncbi:MAG: ABC transporter ATP-binding protein [Ruminococcaceae bacterium]|nr:ABC transporter ATP-binding protein [Oscillospiraceae bacterium]